MSRCLQILVLALVSLSMAAAQQPSVPNAPVRTADDALDLLKGKPLFLRGFWADDKLEFDASGQLKKASRSVPFTTAGFALDNAEVKHKTLYLKGERVGICFDRAGNLKRIPIPKNSLFKADAEKIEVRIDASQSNDFSAGLKAIFADGLEEIAPSLPTYWKNAVGKVLAGNPVEPKKTYAPEIHHVGGDVTEPKLLKNVDPIFSEAARRLKFSGETEVYAVIEPDGTPTHLMISKPAGLGLDEAALNAVSQYRFKPATQDGGPVKVELYIDVNFQIF